MLLNHQENELSYNETATFMLLEDASATGPTASFTTKGKTRGRKRVPRVSKIQQVLNNLPAGVTYIGPEGGMTEENVMSYAKNPTGYRCSTTNLWEDNLIFEQPQPKSLRDDER